MGKIGFDLECPNCHRKFSIPIQDVHPGNSKHCPYCNILIEFSGDDGRKVQKGIDKLNKSIKKLNRKFKL